MCLQVAVGGNSIAISMAMRQAKVETPELCITAFVLNIWQRPGNHLEHPKQLDDPSPTNCMPQTGKPELSAPQLALYGGQSIQENDNEFISQRRWTELSFPGQDESLSSGNCSIRSLMLGTYRRPLQHEQAGKCNPSSLCDNICKS